LLVDSHAHLNAGEFDADRAQVLIRAEEAGVGLIIDIGTDLASSRASLELSERYPHVFTAVGFHPHNAAKMTEDDLAELKRLSRHKKIVAIGEIGLDFYRNLSPKEVQLEAFGKQLRLAQEYDLPVVIHSRNAAEETLAVLTEWAQGQSERRPLGVLHCFSGDAVLAQKYLELGFFISIAGPVTYPSSQASEVINPLPLEGLVVETDCPYLAPQPHRGRRNEPAFLPLTVEKLAQVKGIAVETVAQATTENAIRLFRLQKGFIPL
jgi:TatD DNase family protein